MRRSRKEDSFGAGEGRGINAHPNPKNKNLGGETSKKGLAVIISAILVISAIAVMPAVASDWQQFQKDEVNIGRTGDSAPITAPDETVSWNHHTANASYSGIDTVPIVVGDYVYALAANADNSYLYKYYKNGSSAGWTNDRSVALGSGGYQNSVPAYGEGKIFVLNSDDGDLYAVNADTGDECWNVSVTVRQLSCPITYYNDSNVGRLFFGDCQGGTFYYCYYANNGTEAWSRSASGENYWAGAAVIGDYIVFGNDNAVVRSLYLNNGTGGDSLDLQPNEEGQQEIRSSISWNATNATYGHIFFTYKSSDPKIGRVWKIGFDKTTGDIVGSDKQSSNDIRYSTSTPAVYKGRVYAGGGNFTETEKHQLHCLNESNLSQEFWYVDVNGAVQSSPVISTWYDNGTNNEIYIYITTNCANGRVYCIDNDGTVVWNYESTSDNKYMLAGAAVSGGWVFAGDDAGYIYGLANWTRYDFDVRAGEDKWAFEGEVSGTPSTANDPSGATVTYSNIKADDGTYEKYVTVTDGYYAAQRFNFSIDDNEESWITKIGVTWNGKGYHDSATDGATLYIWNGTAYEELANNAVGTDATLTGEVTSGISSYINAGNVTVLVKQKSAQLYDEGNEVFCRSYIETDYVKLVVTP